MTELWKEDLFSVTSTLHRLCNEQFDAEARSEAAQAMLFYITQMKDAQAKGETLSGISRDMHAACDTFIAEGKKESPHSKDIRCQSGCAHCCCIAVAVSNNEAHELIDYAQQKGITIDRAKLSRQEAYDDDTWIQQPREDRRCVFLGADNTCQVYDARPFSCRKYFAVTAPDLCNVERYPSQEIGTWFDIWSELLASAAMTYFGADFLPKALLAALPPATKEDTHGV
jgi:Fe-S-cluster containining protein